MWQIIGAGAIGCLTAAHLLRTGEEVHLISRTPPFSTTLKFRDLQQQIAHYSISNSATLLNNRDPIIVCVKATQVLQAIKQHYNEISPSQLIILFHNGMGCAEEVRTILPNNPLICATTANASLQHRPFDIEQTGNGISCFGAFDSKSLPATPLLTPLLNALENSCLCDDIAKKLWLKLIINIAINPLTALNQVKNGSLRKTHFQDQIKELVKECLLVTEKQGLVFFEDELLTTINHVVSATAKNFSSMNRDIFYQRQSEIDYINGYLIKKGAQHHIALPLISSHYQRVKASPHRSLIQ